MLLIFNTICRYGIHMEYFSTHCLAPVADANIVTDKDGTISVENLTGTTLVAGDQAKIPIFDTVSEIQFKSLKFPSERNPFSGVEEFKFSESGEYTVRPEYSNQYLFTEEDFIAGTTASGDSELNLGDYPTSTVGILDASESEFNFSYPGLTTLFNGDQPSYYGHIEIDGVLRTALEDSALSLLGYRFLFLQTETPIYNTFARLQYRDRLPVLWQRNFFRRIVKPVFEYSNGGAQQVSLTSLNNRFEVPIPQVPMLTTIPEILNSAITGFTTTLLPDSRLKISHDANTEMLAITSASIAAKYGAELLGFAAGHTVPYTTALTSATAATDLIADIPPQLHQPICLCSEVLAKNTTTFINNDFSVDDLRSSPYFIWDFDNETETPVIRLNNPTYIEYLDIYWGYPRSELGLINSYISGEVHWN